MPKLPVRSDADSSAPADQWTTTVAALPELLTAEEATLILLVKSEALRKLAKVGQIPAVKIGGDWRVLKTRSLDHRYGPTAPPYRS